MNSDRNCDLFLLYEGTFLKTRYLEESLAYIARYISSSEIRCNYALLFFWQVHNSYFSVFSMS